MKRTLILLALLAGAMAALELSPAGSQAGATRLAPQATLLPPKKASADNAGTGRIAASNDGSVNILAFFGTALTAEQNTALYGDFNTVTLDSGDSGLGNAVAHHAPSGKIWGAWFYGFSDGSAEIHNGLKNPGSGGSAWTVQTIPNSGTGATAPYKVTDLQVTSAGRVYALWARNTVGARFAFREEAGAWSAPVDVPGGLSNVADYNLGVSSDNVVAVSGFDRSSGGLLVQMYSAGSWGAVTNIAPAGGQAYRGLWAADSAGGLRVIWMQVDPASSSSDVYYREWTPAGGWNPNVVRLATPGNTASNGYNISVDPLGTAHIVFSDDSAIAGIQQSYYLSGAGTTFSAPQRIDSGTGGFLQANSRNPDVDANPVNGRNTIHLTFNSNAGGAFANYYTYADLGPLATPTPVASATPTATPTPCTTGVFSDVPPGSTFHPFVTDLVSKGAISGYSDCTFRPSATITRGQVAKVLVLAFGLPLNTAGGPHFNDVAVGSTFYSFIETAFNRGIISGYSDGTFRPANVVTRGQIAKMVTLGRGWTQQNPTTATFSDVPVGSTFFPFVETAFAKGVISGYSDGTFKPSNSATRGQGSKIIDLSIYATAAEEP
ncbi:MAG: S-layer homology domain-containing protein [Chloroflexota bacterium]|nr:S-layer homology domain-containing protein [Chloroflexota bacterium]